MISGAAAQFLASPTDLVKVQMQMEGRRLLEGKKPRLVCITPLDHHSSWIKHIDLHNKTKSNTTDFNQLLAALNCWTKSIHSVDILYFYFAEAFNSLLEYIDLSQNFTVRA